MILQILIYPGLLFIFFMSLLYCGILRKLTARMQNRIGPPIWQLIFDFIKLIGKENIDSEQVKSGFTFWPIIAVSSVFIVGILTPIVGITIIEGDIFILVYFLVLGSLAIYLAGLASSNPYGVVGSIRGIIQMIGYEFPFIISIIVPAIFLGTLYPSVINFWQLHNGWLLFRFPLAATAFFICILAKTELPPFHIPDAHQEIVAGYKTEFTGSRLALIELTHFVKLFVLIALAVALFFGGTNSLLIFLIKTFVLLFFIAIVRVILARFKVDQALQFCWIFGFVALIDLIRVLI